MWTTVLLCLIVRVRSELKTLQKEFKKPASETWQQQSVIRQEEEEEELLIEERKKEEKGRSTERGRNEEEEMGIWAERYKLNC